MPRARDAVMRRLTLKQLRLIVAVHQHASILAASRALGLSQPAATRLIKEAERSLGILFVRGNRGVRPTDRGEALVRHARLVLAQLAHAGEELDDLAEGTGGRIAVGTLLAASARLLPAAIAALHRQRPRVAVTVIEGTNDRLVPALAAGDIDFIVGRLPEFRHRDELVHEPLLVEDSCVVVRARHPLARRRRLALADLAGAGWIMPPPETTLRRQVDKAFHDAGLDAPRPAVQSLSVLTNRALLLATDMVGVWPRQVVLDDVRRGVLAVLPVKLPPTAGPIGIARRRGAMLSPAAAALCTELKRVAERALRRR
jgi:DNA-binding transcriptional LysR family regulator